MALSASRLSAAIRAGIIANVEGATDNQAMTDFCDALAGAIVTEITTYAEAVITTATGGLQTTTALGSPTGPPAPVEQTLGIR